MSRTNGLTDHCTDHYTDNQGYSWRRATHHSEPILQRRFRMLVNYNNLMADSRCSLTVMDLAEVLKLGFGIVTGGVSKQGHPVITFPDIKNTTSKSSTLEDSAYRSLINYLAAIPIHTEIETRFVIIIDRRNSSWSSLKHLLVSVSEYFPGDVRDVLILKPSGFIQKALVEVGYRLIKDDLRINVHFCDGISELRHRIGSESQLTADLGGSLQYHNQEWLEHRAAIERFTASTEAIITSIEELCTRLSHAEFPNDIQTTQNLIKDTNLSKEEITEELQCTISNGYILLSLLKGITPSDQGYNLEESIADVEENVSPSKKVHIFCTEKLLSTLKDTEEGFHEFWEKHQTKLNQCLTLRQFEYEFKNLQSLMEEHTSKLKDMTQLGECPQTNQSYISQMQSLQSTAQPNIEACERLELRGQEFIEADHYAVDCIRPKCLELLRVVQNFNDMTRLRNQLLTASQSLHQRIDRANTWSVRGKELMAGLQLDQCTNVKWVETSISSIDSFMRNIPDEDLQPVEDDKLNGLFDHIGYEYKDSLEESITRVKEVKLACTKRRDNLLRIVNRPVCSVQPVRDNSKTPAAETHSASKAESIKNRNQLSHVVNELIETERNYVYELYSVLNGYAEEFENPLAKSMLPEILTSNKAMIFGNMADIYAFHNNYFLKELENCRENPSEVSKCFSKWKDEFMLYSKYCQNKPDSDSILKLVGDNCFFLLDCQRRLGHKLPLSSYLLKPVQRIMKYQLLIREMLKYTDDEEAIGELQQAMRGMLRAIRYANDIMHEVAISGHKGDMTSYGELLMQGSFCVWSEQSKRALPGIGLKRMSRHIFLYENAILFCKRKDDSDQVDSVQPTYIYKNKIETKHIGLTESIKSDKRKFEVWLHGRSEVYTIQAPSLDVKKTWTLEIANVLSRQFANMKNKSECSPGTTSLLQKRMFPHSKSLPTHASPVLLRGTSIEEDVKPHKTAWSDNLQSMSLNCEDEVVDSDEGCHSKTTDSNNRFSMVTSSDEDKESSTGYISSDISAEKLSVTLV